MIDRRVAQKRIIQSFEAHSSIVFHEIVVCVYCGLRLCHSLIQRPFFSFINDGAEAMAKRAAAVSLSLFTRPEPRAK